MREGGKNLSQLLVPHGKKHNHPGDNAECSRKKPLRKNTPKRIQIKHIVKHAEELKRNEASKHGCVKTVPESTREFAILCLHLSLLKRRREISLKDKPQQKYVHERPERKRERKREHHGTLYVRHPKQCFNKIAEEIALAEGRDKEICREDDKSG